MNIFHETIVHNYTIGHLHNRDKDGFHWHQRSELAYMLQGQCTITVGKEPHLCKPGDLIVVHSGEIHSFLTHGECDIYVCTFDPQLLYRFLPEIKFIQSYISAEALQKAGIAEEITALFGEIEQEQAKQDTCYDMIAQADIIRMYSLLVRHFERETLPDNKSLAKFSEFQAALQYITENYTENITLKSIADQLNYNPSYVSKLFVTYTGVNFKNYLDSFRVRHAIKLVKNTDMTVADIASNCGYNNIRTFNYAFKRISGTSPREMRKANI